MKNKTTINDKITRLKPETHRQLKILAAELSESASEAVDFLILYYREGSNIKTEKKNYHEN